VSKLDGLAFGGMGLAVWSAATLFYAAFGGGLLESAFWFYALNAFAAAATVTFAFPGGGAADAYAAPPPAVPDDPVLDPGPRGRRLVIARYAEVMPRRPISIGRYGAFLA
jgi:hypothetical protein